MVNADKHDIQYPQFKALLDTGDSTQSSADDDPMAVSVRRRRQGIDRRRLGVGLAVLSDNEIIGRPIIYLHFIAVIPNGADCCHHSKAIARVPKLGVFF